MNDEIPAWEMIDPSEREVPPPIFDPNDYEAVQYAYEKADGFVGLFDRIELGEPIGFEIGDEIGEPFED